jgi:cephalosporin hydroxylase
VIIETGVAHGGSLVFYASLLKAMGKGRVVGIDIEIRPHNKAAIDAHPLKPLITTIEGSSIAPETIAKAKATIAPRDTVLVLLDSNHTYDHVTKELEAYASMVTIGSYIVVTDGVMEFLAGDPRTTPEWKTDNPRRAALEFVAKDKRFVLERPQAGFDEASCDVRTTYWPDAYLKRIA